MFFICLAKEPGFTNFSGSFIVSFTNNPRNITIFAASN